MFKSKMLIIAAVTAVALAGCSTNKSQSGGQASSSPAPSASPSASSPATAQVAPADYVKAFKDMLEELGKSANGGKVDFAKVETLYNGTFKKLALARDPESSEQQLASSIKAGKDGTMKPEVVQQLVDKLGQKVLNLALKNELKDLETNFADKTKAKASLDNAKIYYGVIKTTVEKRDTAYKTQMSSAIDGAFNDIGKSIDSGKKLDLLLAKQVVDKTIMKTFYLATGAEQGYAYKIQKAVSEGKDPKTEQAEGWAFYQSLYGYLSGGEGGAKADADFIMNQFDLKTNTKDVKADEINKAFIRGYASVAKNEYKQTFANFDQDKGPVTALEGALFIQLLEFDTVKVLGTAESKSLNDKAAQLLEAVKAKDKAKSEALYKEIEAVLDKLAKTGK